MGTGRSTRRVIALTAALFSLGLATALTSAASTGIGGITLPLSTSSTSSMTSSTSTTSSSHSSTSAGKPAATNVLLCGTYTPGSDKYAGQSSVDHPSGASATGQEYDYTGQTCEGEYNGTGGFDSGTGMFSWTVSHSNVNTSTERGTEHGIFMLQTDTNKAAGFNGHVTDFDFPSDCTSGNRVIYYTSGHAYDSVSPCGGSGPGNFNTHGGAATGDHFRGTYGTVVYQDQNNSSSPCSTTGATYCFEAVLEGQTN